MHNNYSYTTLTLVKVNHYNTTDNVLLLLVQLHRSVRRQTCHVHTQLTLVES